MEHFILASLWIGWCFFHSYLIAPSVTRYLQDYLGDKYHYFRLFYNILATISFVLIWLYDPVAKESILFSWDGYQRVVQVVILVLSIGLFIGGAKNYDLLQFLGIRQASQKKSDQGLSESGGFNTTGILKYTRHPWYLGGILLVWTNNSELSGSKLIMNVILTLYFIIGTYLEEKKLLTEFGDEYRVYQKQVSMLFPIKSFRR